MTIAQHGTPATQPGPQPGPLGAGGPPAPPQPYGWQPTPARAQRSKVLPIAIGAAIVLSTAALVVGIVALLRPIPAPQAAPQLPAQTHATGSTDANRSFCTDIAPLMTESDKSAQAFNRNGKPNSPEWKAGVPPFVSDTKSWVGRMQTVIDSHGDADPYLSRSMQRFVDDRRYLIADLEAGAGAEWLPYDQTVWNDSLAAGSGPLTVCFDLGVKW